MRRRFLVRALLATCASIVVCDLALTLFVLDDGALGWRPVPPFSSLSSPQQRQWLAAQQLEEKGARKDEVLCEFDAELGWCNPRLRRTREQQRPAYSYEPHGARSPRDYADAPPANVTRITCFGESFTHGDEVSDADTWQLQLEALDARYEALNFGVGAYGSDQALLRMRREGLHQASIACMGFMLENIGRNVNRYRPLWYPTTSACGAKPRFVPRDGELALVPLPYATRTALLGAVSDGSVIEDLAEHEHWSLETRMGWLGFSGLLRLGAAAWAYERREIPALFADHAGEPYVVSLALLEAFVREARELGARRALVIVFPRELDVRALASDGARFWSSFVDELRARGVEVLDVGDALASEWRRAQADPSLPRLFQGAHYSGAGNAVVARELARHLQVQATDSLKH